MKLSLRAASVLVALLFALVACTPRLEPRVQDHVVPTLISVTVTNEGTLALQGRYFADGANGAHEHSFVQVGTSASGEGGTPATVITWTSSYIEAQLPAHAPHGFVYVSVAGIPSNALPFTAPGR